MKIKLTQNKIALVDECDFDKLNKFKWYAMYDGYNYYAVRSPKKKNGKRNAIRMHREIMNNPKGKVVDHRDGNGLNNRRSNLRICTQSQNSKNQGLKKNNTSGLKGVSFNKKNSKWVARISVNNKRIHLGSFNSKEKAYEKYCNASKKYHKEYSKVS